DGIRDFHVTGVQTCALPIWPAPRDGGRPRPPARSRRNLLQRTPHLLQDLPADRMTQGPLKPPPLDGSLQAAEIRTQVRPPPRPLPRRIEFHGPLGRPHHPDQLPLGPDRPAPHTGPLRHMPRRHVPSLLFEQLGELGKVLEHPLGLGLPFPLPLLPFPLPLGLAF